MREKLETMVSLCPSGRLQYSHRMGGELVEPPYEPSIGVQVDGPLLVRGGIRVVSSDGETWQVRNRVTLCRCGHSSNKPFCDGTHKVIGFRAP